MKFSINRLRQHYGRVACSVLLIGATGSSNGVLSSTLASTKNLTLNAVPAAINQDDAVHSCDSPIKLHPQAILSDPNNRSSLFGISEVSHVAWSSDGGKIASYVNQGSGVDVWTLDGSLVERGLNANALTPTVPLQFVLNDRALISSEARTTAKLGFLSLTAVIDNQKTRTVDLTHGVNITDSPVAAFAYSPSTNVLALLEQRLLAPMLKIYQVDAKYQAHLIMNIPQPNASGSALAFSQDGLTLFVGTYVGQVNVYSPRTGSLLYSIDAFPKNLSISGEVPNAVNSLAVSSDGRYLAIGAGVFGLERHRPADLTYGVRDPAIAKEPFVSGQLTSPIRIYDLLGLGFLPARTDAVQPVVELEWVSTDDVAFLDGLGRIGMLNCVQAPYASTLNLIPSGASSFAFSPRKSLIAVTSSDKIAIFAVSTDEKRDRR